MKYILCFLLLSTVVIADEEFKNDVWNKWDTEHFSILSLDKSQGYYLKSNIEDIRLKTLSKWRLPDGETKYKLVCVRNAKELNKLFNLNGPYFELRDKNIENFDCVIWIDSEKISSLPFIILKNEVDHGAFDNFVKVGIPFLERSVDEIKNDLVESKDVDFKFLYDKSKEDVANSALVCLMIRKELGKANFEKILNSQDEIHESLGFKDQNHFLSTLNRYKKNLISDIKEEKMPDSYLEIKND